MKKQQRTQRYIKAETFWIGIAVAFFAGLFGGVALGIFKDRGSLPPSAQAPSAQTQENLDATAANLEQIAALEKETAVNPGNTGAWKTLGNLYFDTGQTKKAIGAYEKYLAADPDNADVWTDLGVMYRRNGQSRKAVDAFDKAIEIDPKHEVSRFNKGVVLLHDLKDTKGALAAWNSLLEINPLAMAPNGQSVDELVQRIQKQTDGS